MKKKSLYILMCFGFHLQMFAQSAYNGNGQSGFGGAIGTSSLSANDDGTTINFTLTRGAGLFSSYFTIYIDSKSGGFTSTAGFNDQADANRKAVSGVNGTGRSIIFFPSGFEADFALVVHTGYTGLFSLANGDNNSLGLIRSVGSFNNSNFTGYSFSIQKNDLGIAATNPIGFSFTATYGNPNDASPGYFRSNEGYGGGLPSGNPGMNPISFNSAFSYPLIIAPLNLNTFTGVVKNESIELKWSTVSEQNLSKFIIEKSTNGLNFYVLAEVDPKNLITGASYIHMDNALNVGNNFYRIIARNNAGDKAYSKVIRMYYGKIDNNLTLFPNPTRELLNINFMSAIRGTYTLDVFTDAGQKLISQSFVHNGIDKIIKVSLPFNMKKGPYRIYIANQYEFYKGTFIVQ